MKLETQPMENVLMSVSPGGFDSGNRQVFYEEYYSKHICETGLASRVVSFSHRAMESSLKSKHFSRVLEVGAGKGEHLKWVRHSFDNYLMTDIEDRRSGAPLENNLAWRVADAQNLPLETSSFDRVIATCLLHHLPNPEESIKEMRRVTVPGGLVSIFLPCDPGLLVRFARALTTSRSVRRAGFDGYKLFLAREHRNHIGSLLEMARWVFRDDSMRERWFPFPIRSWNLNGFVVLHARKNAGS